MLVKIHTYSIAQIQFAWNLELQFCMIPEWLYFPIEKQLFILKAFLLYNKNRNCLIYDSKQVNIMPYITISQHPCKINYYTEEIRAGILY